jgi:pantothenate kinase
MDRSHADDRNQTPAPPTPLLEQPVQHLVSRLASQVPRWMIGMAGVPGAGKSTLAARLADAVNAGTAPNTLIVLGMDGFHLTKSELSRLPNPTEAFARRGAPWTFDTRALAQRLHRLREAAGRAEVTWPGFQHDVGDPVEGAYVIPASTRLVLVEGLYLLHHEKGWEGISRLFNERWYLDTPVETAMARLRLRHMQAWGLTRGEAEARIAANDRLNAAIVLASAQYADWRLVLED